MSREQDRMLLMLALNRRQAFSSADKRYIAEILRDTVDLERIPEQELNEMTEGDLLDELSSPWDPLQLLAEAEEELSFLERRQIEVVVFGQREYPPQLLELYDPPAVLYLRGRWPAHSCPQVAIVGTRRPSPAAERAAVALGRGLARAGIPVVSGLARGIDGASHRGALQLDGSTVAVLGSGIDRIYPPQHALLAARIVEAGGAIVSEYPTGFDPDKLRFPERNRIISGLARTVVICEAPKNSGALITAEYALDQGRDVVVHAAGLRGVKGAGTLALATDGAAVIETAEDILRDWGLERRRAVAGSAELSAAELLEAELAAAGGGECKGAGERGSTGGSAAVGQALALDLMKELHRT